MAHCGYDGGCFMDMDVAHQESMFEERVSSYGGDTHIYDDVGIDVVDFI